MAQRFFNQFSFGLEKAPVTLFCTFVGQVATGNCVIQRGKGIASVNHTATGKYTITLSDPYFALLNFSAFAQSADGSTKPTAADWFLMSHTVASANPPAIVTWVYNVGTTPALTDLAANELAYVEIVLSNSSAL